MSGGPADVGALADFFGKLSPDRQKLLAEDVFARETFNLPKAYEGKNRFLENVLDYLITKEGDWYCTVALPWMQTDDLSVAWEIFRFNKTLMDLEPEQAAPRYVTAERERRTDALVRRGLGFIIEHGFYTTEEGRQHYLLNLRQISDSVHETAYFGVVRALLTCQDHYKAWNFENGPMRQNIMDILKTELRQFGCVQKDELGLYMLDAQIKHDFRRHGREHDLIVVPDTMSMYVTMVPQYQREYWRHGPGVKENLERGEDGFLSFRGSRVVETRPFDLDFMGQGVDLLVRDVQISDWFEGKTATIYCADTDSFKDVDAQNAKVHIKWDNNNKKWKYDDSNKTESTKVIMIRPWRRYAMGSVIFMKGGMQTGFTAHGHHDFQLSDDVIRKVHVGHYSFYHKSIVKDPKNVFVAENVFGRDYYGGEGHGFLTKQDIENAKSGNWEDVTGSILVVDLTNSPLDKTTEVGGVPGKLPDVALSLGGATYNESINNKAARYAKNDVVGLDIYAALGMSVNKPDTNKPFLTDMAMASTMAYKGMKIDDSGNVLEINKGPWGPNVYEGCIKARSGEMAFLRDCQYSAGGQLSMGRTTTTVGNGISAGTNAAPSAPSGLGSSSAASRRGGRKPTV